MEERRGRPKDVSIEEKPRKFIRVYEDELTTETWTFDLDKQPNGPILVDIKYKVGAEKALKLRAKEAKQQKKVERQMKKLEKNENGKTKRRILP